MDVHADPRPIVGRVLQQGGGAAGLLDAPFAFLGETSTCGIRRVRPDECQHERDARKQDRPAGSGRDAVIVFSSGACEVLHRVCAQRYTTRRHHTLPGAVFRAAFCCVAIQRVNHATTVAPVGACPPQKCHEPDMRP